MLASEGESNLWLVIVVATFAAWTGGYVGYRLGARAGSVVADHGGRRQRQRRQVMAAGERRRLAAARPDRRARHAA